ncbi:Lipoamide acyltransferase component of branched-chain alpha-keto acid dehydrogenase complex [Venturia nashicola]|uniref:Lipoamide acyltransferase component of branched-chain alpha-keto acid dehydrogenase complex n=1 Tax=Venturia nashicola TaxID=86259 RepID=A0A4Z1P296_9PEZI|nr:Lipoamide acyltransferase component of branched-chain alpha-keto acid dehydrogenase complex [Venturia nashicola]TLD34635.1 Lipoamide acyltransferase component of branched-chain alpha-keto acid dehydrogenase complex [Venturia nashicola]
MAQQREQQFIIGEFIEKVKKQRLGRDNPYVYDHTKSISSNRGNKLNRNAKFVHEGKLNNSTLFRQTIEHAGFKRDIISVNPPYYTPDGDVIEDESDVDDDDETLEENIYKDVRIEELLAPLTAASDLPSHPTFSLPYRDKGLPELIRNAEDMLHREQRVLWKMKRLFTEMRGDSQWAPVGLFHTPHDDMMMGIQRGSMSSAAILAEVPQAQQFQEPSNADDLAQAQQEAAHMADDVTISIEPATNGGAVENGHKPQDVELKDYAVPSTNGATPNGTSGNHVTNGATLTSEDATMQDSSLAPTIEECGEQADTGTSVGDADSTTTPAHRMTTRAQANQPTRTPSLARSVSPGSSVPVIHPFYEFPSSVVRELRSNVGLPPQMADEARLALTTYISKQEEIVRSCKEMHSGLLKAMEMRTNVWNWTKAEGHLGEMSDNEDYVDLEEWGIDPRDTRIKYVKGQQEDEQEAEEQERVKRNPRRVGRAAKE